MTSITRNITSTVVLLKTNFGLQTWNFPRRIFCWRFAGFRINFRRSVMSILDHKHFPISSLCKKQTAVSHSCAESEIMSLDEGLRVEGTPALEMWDCVASRCEGGAFRAQVASVILCLILLIFVASMRLITFQVTSPARLFKFEDNEALFRMIIQGCSPNLRRATNSPC